MADANNFVYLRGNIVQQPESKTLGSGNLVAKARLAVDRRKKMPDGTFSKESSFFDVSGFGEQATQLASLAVGQRISVIGTLRQRSWKAQDGSNRSAVEVMAEAVCSEIKPVAAPRPDVTFEQMVPAASDSDW